MIKEISLAEFKRQPAYYVADVYFDLISERRTKHQLIVVHQSQRIALERANMSEPDVSNFKMKRYGSNWQALDRALDQMFDLAARGKTVSLKAMNYDGKTYTIFMKLAAPQV